MAAISSYYMLARATEILDEDQEWLHELSLDMFAEVRCVTIFGITEASIGRSVNVRRSRGSA